MNGIDDDCNPSTPANPASRASARGAGDASSSDVGLLLVPLAWSGRLAAAALVA